MHGDRMDRINSLVQQEIAYFFERHLPGKVLLSVEQAIVSRDLKHATIYLKLLRGKLSGAFFNRIKPSLAEYLSKRVKIKYLPIIKFVVIDQYDLDKFEKTFQKLENKLD